MIPIHRFVRGALNSGAMGGIDYFANPPGGQRRSRPPAELAGCFEADLNGGHMTDLRDFYRPIKAVRRVTNR
jgi:hypothetical protein